MAHADRVARLFDLVMMNDRIFPYLVHLVIGTTHTRVSHVPNRNLHRVSRGIFSFNYYTISIHDSSKLKIIAEALAEQRQLLCGETASSRCSTHSTRYIRHTIRYLGTACGIFDEVAELLLTGSLTWYALTRLVPGSSQHRGVHPSHATDSTCTTRRDRCAMWLLLR